MKSKILNNPDKVLTAAAYILALLAVGAIVYWMPGIFVGIICGYGIGANQDKIKQWLEN